MARKTLSIKEVLDAKKLTIHPFVMCDLYFLAALLGSFNVALFKAGAFSIRKRTPVAWRWRPPVQEDGRRSRRRDARRAGRGTVACCLFPQLFSLR